jgi:hypothetical protein
MRRTLALPLGYLSAAFRTGVNRFWFCHVYFFIWLLCDQPEEFNAGYRAPSYPGPLLCILQMVAKTTIAA